MAKNLTPLVSLGKTNLTIDVSVIVRNSAKKLRYVFVVEMNDQHERMSDSFSVVPSEFFPFVSTVSLFSGATQ